MLASTRIAPAPASTRRRRSLALDRLRGLALVAMLFHHLLSWFSGGAREVIPGWRWFAVTDVAAVAFFFVAGSSVALFTSSRRRRGVPRLVVALEILRRYGLLVPIGVAVHLVVFRTEYAFGVLEAIGVTVVLGTLIAALLPDRWLPPAAVAVVGSGVWVERVAGTDSGSMVERVVGGTFPVVTYLGFVLVGIAVVRSGKLEDRTFIAALAVVGSALTAALLAVGIEPDRYPGGVAFVVPGLAGTAVAYAVCQLRWPDVLGPVDRLLRGAGARAFGLFLAHYAVFWLLGRFDLMRSFDPGVGLAVAAALTVALCVVAPLVPQLPWSPRTGRRP